LHDGKAADLHLIELSDTDMATVVVIVPGTGETIASTPPPSAIAASPRIGVVLCDAFALITSASASTRSLLGSQDSIIGTSAIDLIHPDDREMAVLNWSAAKEQRGVALRWRCRLARTDGSSLGVEVTITNEIAEDGVGDVRIDLYDISLELAATEALVAERELIGLLTETLPVGVVKFDASGRVEHANGRLAQLLAPLDPGQLLDEAMHGDLEHDDLAAAFATLLDDGTTSRLIVEHLGDDGAEHHLEWTIRAAFGEGGTVTGGVACIADVTEAVQLRAALESRAITDALTGCLNRAGTISAIEGALASVGPDDGVGVLFIDLDDFKSINDSHGHAIGDAVLEVVASRLRGALRAGDLVGRLGGDEFVVISPGLHSASDALSFAGRMAQQLRGPAVIDGITVPIDASCGVAWTATDTASELLGAADTAMYAAKQSPSPKPVLSPAASAT
jgi:diguanylate cyclase (GGDEF)-like protein